MSTRRSDRDRGFTVIEMMVAITLSGIVGAMVTTVIVESFHQQSSADARTAAVANVRTALQRTMREIREAQILAFMPNSLKIDDGSRTLTYSLQTADGVTSLTVDDGSTSSVVVSHVVNDASQDVFTPTAIPGYPDPTGTVDTSTCVIIGQTPKAYAPDCVGIITVHLRVMPTTASGHPLCDPTGGCVIDVSDDAGIRNNS